MPAVILSPSTDSRALAIGPPALPPPMTRIRLNLASSNLASLDDQLAACDAELGLDQAPGLDRGRAASTASRERRLAVLAASVSPFSISSAAFLMYIYGRSWFGFSGAR